MRRRLFSSMLVVGAVALTRGHRNGRRELEAHRGQRLQRRHRLLADGLARRVRRRVHPGPQVRDPVRDRRAPARSTARRSTCRSPTTRPTRPPASRQMKDLIGQGYKIIAGADVLGRRAPGGAARGAEPGAVHLRPGGLGRDHRDQQVHVPLRPPDLPGRRHGRDLPRQDHRQERRSCSPRTRRSARATTRRSRRSSAARATTSRRSTCRCPRPTSRRSPSRRSRRSPTCSTSRGPGTTAAQMWTALDQQSVFSSVDNDRHRPRRAGDLPELRPGDREDPLPLALRLPGAERTR